MISGQGIYAFDIKAFFLNFLSAGYELFERMRFGLNGCRTGKAGKLIKIAF